MCKTHKEAFTPGPWYAVLNTAQCWDINVDDNLYAQSIVNGLGSCRYLLGSAEGNAHLIAAAPELFEALEGVLLFDRQPDETAEEHFERIAASFRRDTGLTRPGKEMPPPYFDEDYETRVAAFGAWADAFYSRARQALAKARGEVAALKDKV